MTALVLALILGAVVPLKAGERAPFTGQLVPTEQAIRLLQAAEGCDERIAAEIARAEGLGAARVGHITQLRALDAELWATERQLLHAQIREQDAWYRGPIAVATLTVLGSTLLFIGAIQAVQTAH